MEKESSIVNESNSKTISGSKSSGSQNVILADEALPSSLARYIKPLLLILILGSVLIFFSYLVAEKQNTLEQTSPVSVNEGYYLSAIGDRKVRLVYPLTRHYHSELVFLRG